MLSSRGLNRAFSVFASALLAAGLLASAGCASRPKPEPEKKPVVLGKPVIDFSKGGGGLPLEGAEKIGTNEDLIAGLTGGYQLRIEMPEDAAPIQVEGVYPNLDLLKVDLTGGTVKSKYKPKFNTSAGKIEHAVFARHFQYVARPLTYQQSQTQWNISASDARLGILRDAEDKPSLVLTDVSEGQMDFSVRVDQLKPMMLASAKTHAKGGFWVSDVSLELKSNNPHHIEGAMVVKAVWLLVPATFKIHGTATVDRDCNVTISGVHCEGEDVGGSLLASFIKPAVDRYNGKAMPLASWPGNRIVLRDVAISVGEELKFSAWFEGRKNIAGR